MKKKKHSHVTKSHSKMYENECQLHSKNPLNNDANNNNDDDK